MRARENPFATDRIERLGYRFEQGGWNELFGRLEDLGHRAAIVGRPGTGKTTLLEQLACRLPPRGFRPVLCRAPCELPAGLRPRDLLLVDSAERLRGPAWWRLVWTSRRVAGLVVATHGPGRLPTLVECRTSPALLADLVGELAGARGRSRLDAAALHGEHRGDIRAALLALYDRWAEAPTPSSRASSAACRPGASC